MSRVLHLEALESHYRLNANRIKDLLQPPNPDGLVVRLLIPADHLLADAKPFRQFGLRDPLRKCVSS